MFEYKYIWLLQTSQSYDCNIICLVCYIYSLKICTKITNGFKTSLQTAVLIFVSSQYIVIRC